MKLIPDDIIEKLNIILHADNDIRFLNMYQGLPISHIGRIIDFSEESVHFHISKYQGLCLQLELSTILMHDLLPKKIKAVPISINLAKEEAVIGSLEYFNTTIDSRQQIRVETNKAIKGVLENGIEVEVKITEVSKTGIGLSMHRRDYNTKLFCKGKPVRIAFSLPLGDNQANHPISMEGIIRNVRPLSNDFYYRIGIECFPRPSAEAVIEKYILIRQEEISVEMTRLCELNIASLFVG
jgi:hypothetical protein